MKNLKLYKSKSTDVDELIDRDEVTLNFIPIKSFQTATTYTEVYSAPMASGTMLRVVEYQIVHDDNGDAAFRLVSTQWLPVQCLYTVQKSDGKLAMVDCSCMSKTNIEDFIRDGRMAMGDLDPKAAGLTVSSNVVTSDDEDEIEDDANKPLEDEEEVDDLPQEETEDNSEQEEISIAPVDDEDVEDDAEEEDESLRDDIPLEILEDDELRPHANDFMEAQEKDMREEHQKADDVLDQQIDQIAAQLKEEEEQKKEPEKPKDWKNDGVGPVKHHVGNNQKPQNNKYQRNQHYKNNQKFKNNNQQKRSNTTMPLNRPQPMNMDRMRQLFANSNQNRRKK